MSSLILTHSTVKVVDKNMSHSFNFLSCRMSRHIHPTWTGVWLWGESSESHPQPIVLKDRLQEPLSERKQGQLCRLFLPGLPNYWWNWLLLLQLPKGTTSLFENQTRELLWKEPLLSTWVYFKITLSKVQKILGKSINTRAILRYTVKFPM